MVKKKKKCKGPDARGYGQATVFREAPPPEETVTPTAPAIPVAAAAGTSVEISDDWGTAIEQDEKPLQTLETSHKSQTFIAKKIPPPANIKLQPATATSTYPSTLVFSNALYELLQKLVAPLAWNQIAESIDDVVDLYPDLLVKKVAFLYDYLSILGISWEHIRTAVSSQPSRGAAASVEATLDWLCYHLETNKLPSRFLDERESLGLLGEYVKDAKQTNESDSNMDNPRPETATQHEEPSDCYDQEKPEISKEEVEIEVFHRHDGNDDDYSVGKGDKDFQVSDLKPLPPEPLAHPKIYEEEKLEELEKMLFEISLDYKDEAANYMRSKHEVKELGNQCKRLKKAVENQKKLVEKAKKKMLESLEQDDPDEDNTLGAGLFDHPVEAKPTAADNDALTEDIPHIIVPENAICKSWTGKNPRMILEERCRVLKLPRPTFKTLDRNGCRVDIEGKLTVEELASFDRKLDGQHYVATKALYALDSTLPIYQSLPPFYRDLWKGWVEKVRLEKDQLMQEKDQLRKEQISELFGLLLTLDSSGVGAKDAKVAGSEMVSGISDKFLPQSLSELQEENVRLRQDFTSRMGTSHYQAMLGQRTTLPIYGFREEILGAVAHNRVTVLHAETGAGKTTQCAQFLLEDALINGRGCTTSILCTQPRRVAATSVAERVSEEMATGLGKQVGYSIRLENRRSSETRLLFCTTGVILRRLIEDPSLSGVSHVIVDEVHERQWQIDVLLVALRKLVGGPRPDLKIVLMSATLDAKLFCSFFDGAPLVSVPGRTFPVSNYFLEDVIEATGHIVEEDSPHALRNYERQRTASINVTTKGGRERKQIVSLSSEVDPDLSPEFPGYSWATRRTMDRVDESVLNYDLIEDVLRLLLVKQNTDHVFKAPGEMSVEKGAVLIFLPGIGEIRTLCDRLRASNDFRNSQKFDIIPMHSSLSSSEQRQAFLLPRKVQWAIIVSTNIAETSVTIPDVVCVIDSGRVREVRHDKRTLTRKLVTTWCSRASTQQRAGRAGRVQPGICIRTFSSRTLRNSMLSTTEPELQRLPLEEVCLAILAGGLASRGCLAFLSQTPQPPTAGSIQAALIALGHVGAISVQQHSNEAALNSYSFPVVESLTPLGLQLAKLPVDARLGKMLLLSVQFRCVDTITTIVAGLSASQSLFLSSLRDAQTAQAKQAIFRHPDSDFLTLLNIYNAFIEAGETFRFCRDNYLSFSALREMKEARKHYLDLLQGMGFLDIDARQRNVNSRDEVVLHAVITSALSQMARIDRTPDKKVTLWHRSIGTTDQQVHVHNSSVNSKLPLRLPSRWLVFFEKFATGARVSISMTAFCSPLVLVLLVGHKFQIQHAARCVEVDGWMKVGMAATTAVRIRALRFQLLDLHTEEKLVDGVVEMLRQDAASAAAAF